MPPKGAISLVSRTIFSHHTRPRVSLKSKPISKRNDALLT